MYYILGWFYNWNRIRKSAVLLSTIEWMNCAYIKVDQLIFLYFLYDLIQRYRNTCRCCYYSNMFMDIFTYDLYKCYDCCQSICITFTLCHWWYRRSRSYRMVWRSKLSFDLCAAFAGYSFCFITELFYLWYSEWWEKQDND